MSETNLPLYRRYTLDEFGLIAIRGEGAEKFLQGQVTCDVTQLSGDNFTYGAHCDPKGRIQFTFQLLKIFDYYILILPRQQIAHALNTLKKYAVFYRTEMTDITANKKIYAISGINSAELLNEYFAPNFQITHQVNIIEQTIIIQIPGAVARFLIIDTPESYEKHDQHLLSKLEKTKNTYWELQNIFAGIATIYSETSGLFTPHDINLHCIGGVSFTKGCFTGQEIIARMQYLGKLKNQLFHIRFTAKTLPSPGTALYDEQNKKIGHIITVAENFPEQFEALALLPINTPTTTIHLAHSTQSILNKMDLTY